MIDFLHRVFSRRWSCKEDDSELVHKWRAHVMMFRIYRRDVLEWLGLGPYLKRRKAHQLAQIDRSGPRFKYDCVTCGQKTTFAGGTFLREDKSLGRVQPQCIDCVSNDDVDPVIE